MGIIVLYTEQRSGGSERWSERRFGLLAGALAGAPLRIPALSATRSGAPKFSGALMLCWREYNNFSKSFFHGPNDLFQKVNKAVSRR